MSDDETIDRGTSAERATLLIAVPSASLAFTLAFNLGAFDTIFFDAVFTMWVIATIVLFGSMVSKLPPPELARAPRAVRSFHLDLGCLHRGSVR
jgi:hypothetical protein